VENGIHYLEDGHFWVEVPGLPESDDEEEFDESVTVKPPSRVVFSSGPMRVYSTHSISEYDRRNDDVDPVAASAEYELEKRVEKMDVFPVDLIKVCRYFTFWNNACAVCKTIEKFQNILSVPKFDLLFNLTHNRSNQKLM